jgi:subfamily B ATP-binding cassette protein MsbA
MRTMGRRLHKLTVQGQGATDELAYVVEENVLAWRIVRLHGAGPAQAGRFRQGARAAAAAAEVGGGRRHHHADHADAGRVRAVGRHRGGAVAGRRGGSSVGGFVAFITAMLLLVHADQAPVGRDGAHHARAGGGGTQRRPDRGQPLRGGWHACAPARAAATSRCSDVGLRYRDDAEPALAGLTCTAHAGETVALVGPSGAGKSTLVNLLPRFIEPTAGELRLDGRPLRDWDMRALRRQFALVSQDVVLFNDTVAANVALGADIDESRVRDALRAANLLDFVTALPQGLQTVVGHNGSQLSGGQRQRLAIARAVYKDAPILILDEATSALDAESERAVQDALERLMKGRTTLVIAHRLATIEHADRVLVLEAGRLVEQGTPRRAAGHRAAVRPPARHAVPHLKETNHEQADFALARARPEQTCPRT